MPSSSQEEEGATPSRVEVSVAEEGSSRRIKFRGHLTVHSLGRIEKSLLSSTDKADGSVIMDLGDLLSLDTAGALLLNQTIKCLQDQGRECLVQNTNEQQERLLQKSVLPKFEDEKSPSFSLNVPALLESLGKKVYTLLELVTQLVEFLGRFLVMMGGIVLHPRRMRWTPLFFHMEQVGLRAVLIVSLLTFLIGLVVAYMGAQQLSMFGADIFAVNLLEITVMREMGVLITAIVVAGRSSSSFTAQIGAMVANEEVDAMRSMGLDPGILLVVPRVLALIICLPMLVFLADIMALIGGGIAIWFTIGLSFNAFISQLHQIASLNNFMVGLVKTPFFAMAIGLVGCFQGFKATSSAESVGFLTTVSVVQSIFIVILLDALFAIFFISIGV